MDEPLSNLDAKLRGQMRAEIRVAAARVRDDDALRHPRPGRGHDDGRPDRRPAQGRAAAAGHARGALRRPGQPVRRRVHRLAADERASARRSSRGSELVVGSQRLALPPGALDGFPSLAGRRRPGRPGAPSGEPARRRRRPTRRGRAWSPTSQLVENVPPEKLVHLRIDAEPVVTDATLEIAKDVDAAAVDELRSLGKGSVLNARPARHDRRPRGHPRRVRHRRRRRCTSSTRPPARP